MYNIRNAQNVCGISCVSKGSGVLYKRIYDVGLWEGNMRNYLQHKII